MVGTPVDLLHRNQNGYVREIEGEKTFTCCKEVLKIYINEASIKGQEGRNNRQTDRQTYRQTEDEKDTVGAKLSVGVVFKHKHSSLVNNCYF